MMQEQSAPLAHPLPRRVSILGSTGSVGCNTVDLIQRDPERFSVEALTAKSSVDLLADQARRLGARMAVVADDEQFGALKKALAGTSVEVGAGPEALIEAACRPADLVMAAIVGAAGLAPTLAAVRRGANLYLVGVFFAPEAYQADTDQLAGYAARHAMAVVMANAGGPATGFASAGGSAVWSDSGALVARLDGTGAGLVVARRSERGWSGKAVPL